MIPTAESLKGGYRLIRVDGTESLVEQKPTIRAIQRDIGCQVCDTVTLDGTNMIIMVVDDTGMLDRKPINRKASEMVRSVFGPQYPYDIHGDVAIVWDGDFA